MISETEFQFMMMGIQTTHNHDDESCFCLFSSHFDYTTRRRQQSVNSASCYKITSVFVLMVLLLCPVFPATSAEKLQRDHHVFRPQEEINKTKLVEAHLMKINKPFVKSIQSPDGDTIDCVLIHHQPAFDHPKLKGTKPLDPPERPDGHEHDEGEISVENYQLWSLSGESCPEGTIPIRRTTQQDILRANSVKKFGRKTVRPTTKDTFAHEHAIGYVDGNKFYGAKASINVWAPKVSTNRYEFSLSQLWLTSGTFNYDLNTIETGWQVFPSEYGDSRPRFFIYWTRDDYATTGCYNLQCSGFVQTSRRIAVGTAINPPSVYNGGQFDITLMVWKDPKHGSWWLQLGSDLIGYWPAYLFSRLRDHASMVQFGGEVVNTWPRGSHTTTQMGSGHFAGQGFGRASYVRNMQVVDWGNTLIPLSNMKTITEHPNCYDIRAGISRVWGNYIYYGGPGKNPRCP